MRLKKDDLERNRQEIPGAAQKLFRERGFDGVGVSDLMKAAGFTRGAFYNHFASRDQLAGEAAAAAFARSNAALAEALDKKGTGGWGDRGDRADNPPSVHSPHLTTPRSRGRNTPCLFDQVRAETRRAVGSTAAQDSAVRSPGRPRAVRTTCAAGCGAPRRVLVAEDGVREEGGDRTALIRPFAFSNPGIRLVVLAPAACDFAMRPRLLRFHRCNPGL